MIAVSFLAAGFAEVLLPHAWMRGALGADSGLRGILLAHGGGRAHAGGPLRLDADRRRAAPLGRGAASVVAFLTALVAARAAPARRLGGADPGPGRFALVRYAVSIALPVAAGVAARLLTR